MRGSIDANPPRSFSRRALPGASSPSCPRASLPSCLHSSKSNPKPPILTSRRPSIAQNCPPLPKSRASLCNPVAHSLPQVRRIIKTRKTNPNFTQIPHPPPFDHNPPRKATLSHFAAFFASLRLRGLCSLFCPKRTHRPSLLPSENQKAYRPQDAKRPILPFVPPCLRLC